MQGTFSHGELFCARGDYLYTSVKTEMTSIGLLVLLLAAVVSGAIITRDAEKKIKSEKPEVTTPEVPIEKIDPKKENGKNGQVEVNPPTKDEFLSKWESKLKDVKDGAKNKSKDDVQDLPGKLKPEVNKPAGVLHGFIIFKKKDGTTEQIEVHSPINDESVSNSASQQDDAEVDDNKVVENGKAPAVQMLPFFGDAWKNKREPQLFVLGQHQQAGNGGGIHLTNGSVVFGHYNDPSIQINQVKAKAPKSTATT